jgi:hypothetical protein
MMTLAQAIEEVAPKRAHGGAAKIAERIEKNQALLEEAFFDPQLDRIALSMAENSCCVKHAVLNGMLTGIQIGMLMERPDGNAGVDLDAEPPAVREPNYRCFECGREFVIWADLAVHRHSGCHAGAD